jgi:D-alanine-D-alanine ligase
MQGNRERIGILFGGKSGEHEVSLRSAYSVMANLDAERFEPVMIGIDKEGRWYLQSPPKTDEASSAMVLEAEESRRIHVFPSDGLWCAGETLRLDVVFPVLHGTFGEDGTVQGLLEIADLPYVGAGILGSSLSMDKSTVKRVWTQAGLPVVPFELAEYHRFISPDREQGFAEIRSRVEQRFSYPLFVKPARSGSSVGVTCAENAEELRRALEEAFRFDTKALVEPTVKGREIECSVIGNEWVESFIPGEIVPSHRFYDYEAKYVDPEGADLRIPAPLSAEKSEEIKRIARAAFTAAGGEGMARVDFFLREGDETVLINEINTIPGFTSISMFSKLCEASGLSYTEMLTRIIDLAYDRYSRRASLSYRLL